MWLHSEQEQVGTEFLKLGGAKLFAVFHSFVCVCVCACVCVFSITYVPAEYLEEYKASLEQTQEYVFSETAPVLQLPVPKYVPTLYHSNFCHVITLTDK